MTRLLVVLVAACLLSAPLRASAHALDPGYLDLAALGEESWRVTWRTPDVNGRPMTLAARLPARCSNEALPPAFDGRAWIAAWIAFCPGGLAGGVIEIPGLERTNTDVLVRYELTPGEAQFRRLTADEPSFTVPEHPSALDILVAYTGLGVTHILEGVDHLLFVFVLLLLVRDRARLLWAVTAFTVAHSITLAAASFGFLNVPAPPVEAVIALSIVFLAYELTLAPERRDRIAMRFPWLVSFAFGLIHGLGFAGALREIGLPDADIPLALFAFNAGVELGQLMFITCVFALGWAARRLYPRMSRRAGALSRMAGYGIGSVAAFWTIERIAGF